MAIFEDNFDDNSMDVTKWEGGSIAFQNAGVAIAEVNSQLEITPIANQATPAFYGYKSINGQDLTGLEARVTLAADFGAPSEAWLVVAKDTANYFRIWAVGGGNLQTRSRTADINSNQDHGAFNFTTHKYWRIKHDSSSDEIVWEYSSDDANWNELRRLARPFVITSVFIYLSGGSGSSSPTPPILKFDNFVLQTNAAQLLLSSIARPQFLME